MAAQIDTPMGDAPADTEKHTGDNTAPALVLSDDEARVLALYDQLKTIQLEAALLRAREAHSGSFYVMSKKSSQSYTRKY